MTKAKMDIPANTLASPRRKKIHIGRIALPYVMILPTLILLGVFTFYPAIDMVINSFYEVNVFKGNTFVGFQNYVQLFKHPDFLPAVRNTIIYTIGSVFFMIFLGLVFALWLQRSTFINGIVQRFMFLPHICAFLSVALIFQWLMDDEGLFNFVLSWFELPGLKWFNSSDTALISIMIVNLWKGIGYSSIMYYATVIGIDSALYEAAAIDGANTWKQIWHVTLPGLRGTIIIMVLLALGRMFYSDFGLFYQVPMHSGLLADVTDTIDVFTYKALTQLNDVGRAAAAGFLQSVLGFLTVLTANFVVSKVDPENSLF